MDESLPYLVLAQEEIQVREAQLKVQLALSKGPAPETRGASDATWEGDAKPPAAASLPIAPARQVTEKVPLRVSSGDGGKDDMIYMFQGASLCTALSS